MKTHHSNPMRIDLSHSPATSAFASCAEMSDPAETLLVVDDDPMVRELETQILRLQGYTVLEAEARPRRCGWPQGCGDSSLDH